MEGVRHATPDDAPAIAAIYAPIVADTFISFEEVPPDANEIRRRIEVVSKRYPWLCYETDGETIGYAYASAHRERAAYRWSVDVSAYVRADRRRAGIASALYRELLALVRRQGFYNAFAGITLPNDPSVALHRSLGFHDVGIYRNVGFKLGAWHDTLWLQLALRAPGAAQPALPVPSLSL